MLIYMKYFKYATLLISVIMLTGMIIGYLIGSSILYSGVAALTRQFVMTCTKLLSMYVSKVRETLRRNRMLIIAKESLV